MMDRTIEARSPGYLAVRLFGQRISNLSRIVLETLSLPSKCSDRLLSVEERIAIGPRKTLLLVNCAGRRFLVATAGDAIAPMIEVRPFHENSASGDVNARGPQDGLQ